VSDIAGAHPSRKAKNRAYNKFEDTWFREKEEYVGIEVGEKKHRIHPLGT
jgi:hypothetical protein